MVQKNLRIVNITLSKSYLQRLCLEALVALYQGTAQAQELPHTQQQMEHKKAAKVLETLAKAVYAPGQSVDLHCRRGWLAAAYDQVCLARQATSRDYAC